MKENYYPGDPGFLDSDHTPECPGRSGLDCTCDLPGYAGSRSEVLADKIGAAVTAKLGKGPWDYLPDYDDDVIILSWGRSTDPDSTSVEELAYAHHLIEEALEEHGIVSSGGIRVLANEDRVTLNVMARVVVDDEADLGPLRYTEQGLGVRYIAHPSAGAVAVDFIEKAGTQWKEACLGGVTILGVDKEEGAATLCMSRWPTGLGFGDWFKQWANDWNLTVID